MKTHIFGQCDKCIGITPCRILRDGTVVCEYCNDEVKHLHVEQLSPETLLPPGEQHV